MKIKLIVLNEFEELIVDVEKNIFGNCWSCKNGIGYVIGYVFGVVEWVVFGGLRDYNKW